MTKINSQISLCDDMCKNKYDINLIEKKVTLLGKKYKMTDLSMDADHISLKFNTFSRTYLIEISGLPKIYEMSSTQKMKAQVKIYKRSLFNKKEKLLAIDMHKIIEN